MLFRAWLLTADSESRSPPWPVLRATSQRLRVVVWTGLRPLATALAPVSPENVDKVQHLTVPPLLSLLLSGRSWLVLLLSADGASLLSLPPLSLYPPENQYFTVTKCMEPDSVILGTLTLSPHPSACHLSNEQPERACPRGLCREFKCT